MLGQLVSQAKRLARPQIKLMKLAEGWFRTHNALDDVGRPVRTTTGAEVLELLGAGGKSTIEVAYGSHGLLVSAGGSYGSLITATKHNALGQTTRLQFGDAASTSLLLGYDSARRLSSFRISRAPAPIWDGAPGYIPPAATEPPTTQQVLEDLSFDYLSADRLGPSTTSDQRRSGRRALSQPPIHMSTTRCAA